MGEGEPSAAEVREIIKAASDAVHVFDFETVAERKLAPAHYTFLSMGVQHEVTLRANPVVLTVDIMASMFQQNRDRIRRFRGLDNPACQSCHGSTIRTAVRGVAKAATAVGLDPAAKIADLMVLDWDYVDRIRDATSMNLLIKGSSLARTPRR